MKFSRFTLAAFLVANTAFAANMAVAEDMKISKVQEIATIRESPTGVSTTSLNAPHPATYEMSFSNGKLIPDAAALDGTFRSGTDPRASNGYATCTEVLERPTMPTSAQLDEAPTSSSSSTTFESGREVTVQQVVLKFTII